MAKKGRQVERYLQALAIVIALMGCVTPPRGPVYKDSANLRVVDTRGKVIRDWSLVQTSSGDISVRTRDGKRIGTLRVGSTGEAQFFDVLGKRLKTLNLK